MDPKGMSLKKASMSPLTSALNLDRFLNTPLVNLCLFPLDSLLFRKYIKTLLVIVVWLNSKHPSSCLPVQLGFANLCKKNFFSGIAAVKSRANQKMC